MRDQWARPHVRTLQLDGEPRRVHLARLSAGEKANVELLLAILRQQTERLRRIETEPVAQQIAEIANERTANLQFGAWVEETITAHLRPVEPWTTQEGIEVRDGASFVEAYGTDELIAALLLLYGANTVSREMAKNSASPRGSSPGSVGVSQTARGDGPGPTAAPAAPSDSASPVDAVALHDPNPSGSMTVAPNLSPSSVPSVT